MQLIIRGIIKSLVQSVVWLNRCGALHLYQSWTDGAGGIDVHVVLFHNAHGDLQDEVCLDWASSSAAGHHVPSFAC
jgi:hypothetical protein